MKHYKIKKKKKNSKQNTKKIKYNTIEDYLEKLLYQTLKIVKNDLLNEIKNNDYEK